MLYSPGQKAANVTRPPDRIQVEKGFTLIELAIVLVIIGLIVGSVLVGQNLIAAAQVRAQVTQMEQFNQAANTFRGKYGYLPGDIKDPDASMFGFQSRGTLPGEGDGNGVLEGYCTNGHFNAGVLQEIGENAMFWVDLSTAQLISGSFNTASSMTPSATRPITYSTNPSTKAYFPLAKIGTANFVYVYSGGWGATTTTGSGDMLNYFGIIAGSNLALSNSFYGSMTQLIGPYSYPLTVQQAYRIDTKMDDGLPESGNVLAMGITDTDVYWSIVGTPGIPPFTTATVGSTSTCFDNSATSNGTPGISGAAQHYSLEINGGAMPNCELSFRFQ